MKTRRCGDEVPAEIEHAEIRSVRCGVDAGERDSAFIGREAEIDVAVGRPRRAEPDTTAVEPHQLAQAAAATPRRRARRESDADTGELIVLDVLTLSPTGTGSPDSAAFSGSSGWATSSPSRTKSR